MQNRIVSSSTQRQLARSVSILSAHTANQIRKITNQQAREVAQRRAELAAEAAAEARIAAKQTAIREKRLVLARKGLERLLALGATKEIQKVLTGQKRLSRVRHGIEHSSGVLFYVVSRLSGDFQAMTSEQLEDAGKNPPTRDVFFRFREDALEIEWGNLAASLTDCYQLFYKPRQHDGVKFEVEMNGCFDGDREEQRSTSDEFLQSIATHVSVNMGAIRHFYQRKDVWEPETVAFQVLVSCGRKKSFEAYLQNCIANLESAAD